MSESAMTTEEVVEIYYDAPGMQSIAMAGTFERWLAHHDAQVAAQALRDARDMLANSPAVTIAGPGGALELLDAEIDRIEAQGVER